MQVIELELSVLEILDQLQVPLANRSVRKRVVVVGVMPEQCLAAERVGLSGQQRDQALSIEMRSRCAGKPAISTIVG